MKMNGKDVNLVTDYMFVGFLTYLFRNCSSKFDYERIGHFCQQHFQIWNKMLVNLKQEFMQHTI